jgi:arsenate reductase-like glutaredoxin family protein
MDKIINKKLLKKRKMTLEVESNTTNESIKRLLEKKATRISRPSMSGKAYKLIKLTGIWLKK